LSQQMNSRLVATSALVDEPYSSILGYPKSSRDELESRVNELKSIGVQGILFEGNSKIGKLDVLGKGCVSVVVKAVIDDQIVALKIRRLDADRESMEREAEMLKIANSVGVGPKHIGSSKNCVLMDLANGIKIIDLIMKMDNKKSEIKSVALDVLEQCYKLDKIGLDHGELSNLNKHVIVGDAVTIIDFESASVKRRVANVTAATQCLFIGSAIARKVCKLLKIGARDEIIRSLREYKSDKSKENLERLQKVLGLA